MRIVEVDFYFEQSFIDLAVAVVDVDLQATGLEVDFGDVLEVELEKSLLEVDIEC